MLNKEQLLLDVFQAYYDARRNKRNTKSQVAFEMNYESHLLTLHQELINNTYIWKNFIPTSDYKKI